MHHTISMDDRYLPTPRGEAELQGGRTTLAAAALEVLVRLDGTCTLREVHECMQHVPEERFVRAVRQLCERALVRAGQRDDIALRLDADLQRMQLTDGAAAAGPASLRASNFRVAIARPRPKRPPPAPGPLTALVVEDEPTLARFIQCYLHLEGIETRLATDRAEVVAQLRKPPAPDVVLLDVTLPDVDGFHILERVREHPQLRDTPVILLTGHSTRACVLRGMHAGADGYLTKPFQADVLVKAVRTVLGPCDEAAAAADPWSNWDTKARRETALVAG